MENKENSESRSKIFENSAEFIGYRLLYSMLTKSHTGNLFKQWRFEISK